LRAPSRQSYPAFVSWSFTYAVHGFKAILLKDGGFTAIRFDLLFLVAFGIAALAVATPLFKRTL
jgi:ABC-2 type transport system permease protein